MTKAKLLLWLSLLLLAISLLATGFLALVANLKAERALVAFLAGSIVHLGVVLVLMLALKEWWRLRDRSWGTAVREIPRWTLALGVPVIVAAMAGWPTLTPLQRTTDTGVPVTQFEISTKKDRYFLQQNFGTPQEISKAEYEELWRQVSLGFAVGWIVLSYAGICFWRIVVRLENDQAAGVG
jgi:hypothetical protein